MRSAPSPLGQRARDAGLTESEALASAILTIDLTALVDNYLRLSGLSRPAECAAVVKADAYGLGMARVAPALERAGCRTFFVATLSEAIALRQLLPAATIYVFDGLFEGTASLFAAHELRPVLNSLEEIEEWAAFCRSSHGRHPAAIHVDSGMNRLGLSAPEIGSFDGLEPLLAAFDLRLVISHLACADDPGHPKSAAQRRRFDELRARLPQAAASLANSAGILLGRDYLYDLVRPGIALYGGRPRRDDAHTFAAVVRLEGRIVQVRQVPAGETVGYGATWTVAAPARIATVAVGYADGLFRALSRKDGEDGLAVFIGGHPAPILGRVSMDLITLDVTAVPRELARRGDWVELIGDRVTAQDHAGRAGTIDYEVLTNLGRRALRKYIGG